MQNSKRVAADAANGKQQQQDQELDDVDWSFDSPNTAESLEKMKSGQQSVVPPLVPGGLNFAMLPLGADGASPASGSPLSPAMDSARRQSVPAPRPARAHFKTSSMDMNSSRGELKGANDAELRQQLQQQQQKIDELQRALRQSQAFTSDRRDSLFILPTDQQFDLQRYRKLLAPSRGTFSLGRAERSPQYPGGSHSAPHAAEIPSADMQNVLLHHHSANDTDRFVHVHVASDIKSPSNVAEQETIVRLPKLPIGGILQDQDQEFIKTMIEEEQQDQNGLFSYLNNGVVIDDSTDVVADDEDDNLDPRERRKRAAKRKLQDLQQRASQFLHHAQSVQQFNSKVHDSIKKAVRDKQFVAELLQDAETSAEAPLIAQAGPAPGMEIARSRIVGSILALFGFNDPRAVTVQRELSNGRTAGKVAQSVWSLYESFVVEPAAYLYMDWQQFKFLHGIATILEVVAKLWFSLQLLSLFFLWPTSLPFIQGTRYDAAQDLLSVTYSMSTFGYIDVMVLYFVNVVAWFGSPVYPFVFDYAPIRLGASFDQARNTLSVGLDLNSASIDLLPSLFYLGAFLSVLLLALTVPLLRASFARTLAAADTVAGARGATSNLIHALMFSSIQETSKSISDEQSTVSKQKRDLSQSLKSVLARDAAKSLQQHGKYHVSSAILAFVLSILPSLFIPSVAGLLSTILRIVNMHNGVYRVDTWTYAIISAALLVNLLILSFYYTISFYEWRPRKSPGVGILSGILSRAHSRLDVLLLAVATVLIFSYQIFALSFQWIYRTSSFVIGSGSTLLVSTNMMYVAQDYWISSINVVLAFVVFIGVIHLMPFYRSLPNRIASVLSFNVLCVSIIVLFCAIFNRSQVVLSGKVSDMLTGTVDWRKLAINIATSDPTSSVPLLAYLATLALSIPGGIVISLLRLNAVAAWMKQRKLLLSKPKNGRGLFDRSYRSPVDLEIASRDMCSNIDDIAYCQRIFEVNAAYFKHDSYFHLTWATFVANSVQHPLRALEILGQADSLPMPLDVRIASSVRRGFWRDNLGLFDSEDALALAVDRAIFYDGEARTLQLSLWSILDTVASTKSKSDLDVASTSVMVTNLVGALVFAEHEASRFYRQAIKSCPSAELFRSYSKFLREVVNDPTEADRQMSYAMLREAQSEGIHTLENEQLYREQVGGYSDKREHYVQLAKEMLSMHDTQMQEQRSKELQRQSQRQLANVEDEDDEDDVTSTGALSEEPGSNIVSPLAKSPVLAPPQSTHDDMFTSMIHKALVSARDAAAAGSDGSAAEDDLCSLDDRSGYSRYDVSSDGSFSNSNSTTDASESEHSDGSFSGRAGPKRRRHRSRPAGAPTKKSPKRRNSTDLHGVASAESNDAVLLLARQQKQLQILDQENGVPPSQEEDPLPGSSDDLAEHVVQRWIDDKFSLDQQLGSIRVPTSLSFRTAITIVGYLMSACVLLYLALFIVDVALAVTEPIDSVSSMHAISTTRRSILGIFVLGFIPCFVVILLALLVAQISKSLLQMMQKRMLALSLFYSLLRLFSLEDAFTSSGSSSDLVRSIYMHLKGRSQLAHDNHRQRAIQLLSSTSAVLGSILFSHEYYDQRQRSNSLDSKNQDLVLRVHGGDVEDEEQTLRKATRISAKLRFLVLVRSLLLLWPLVLIFGLTLVMVTLAYAFHVYYWNVSASSPRLVDRELIIMSVVATWVVLSLPVLFGVFLGRLDSLVHRVDRENLVSRRIVQSIPLQCIKQNKYMRMVLSGAKSFVDGEQGAQPPSVEKTEEQLPIMISTAIADKTDATEEQAMNNVFDSNIPKHIIAEAQAQQAAARDGGSGAIAWTKQLHVCSVAVIELDVKNNDQAYWDPNELAFISDQLRTQILDPLLVKRGLFRASTQGMRFIVLTDLAYNVSSESIQQTRQMLHFCNEFSQQMDVFSNQIGVPLVTRIGVDAGGSTLALVRSEGATGQRPLFYHRLEALGEAVSLAGHMSYLLCAQQTNAHINASANVQARVFDKFSFEKLEHSHTFGGDADGEPIRSYLLHSGQQPIPSFRSLTGAPGAPLASPSAQPAYYSVTPPFLLRQMAQDRSAWSSANNSPRLSPSRGSRMMMRSESPLGSATEEDGDLQLQSASGQASPVSGGGRRKKMSSADRRARAKRRLSLLHAGGSSSNASTPQIGGLALPLLQGLQDHVGSGDDTLTGRTTGRSVGSDSDDETNTAATARSERNMY